MHARCETASGSALVTACHCQLSAMPHGYLINRITIYSSYANAADMYNPTVGSAERELVSDTSCKCESHFWNSNKGMLFWFNKFVKHFGTQESLVWNVWIVEIRKFSQLEANYFFVAGEQAADDEERRHPDAKSKAILEKQKEERRRLVPLARRSDERHDEAHRQQRLRRRWVRGWNGRWSPAPQSCTSPAPRNEPLVPT